MSVVLKNFNNEKQIYTFQCHFHNSLSTVCIVENLCIAEDLIKVKYLGTRGPQYSVGFGTMGNLSTLENPGRSRFGTVEKSSTMEHLSKLENLSVLNFLVQW